MTVPESGEEWKFEMDVPTRGRVMRMRFVKGARILVAFGKRNPVDIELKRSPERAVWVPA